MESICYKGWTIRAYRASRGFEAVMVDPAGNAYSHSVISWPSYASAQRYAQKFVDWYIKLNTRTEFGEFT